MLMQCGDRKWIPGRHWVDEPHPANLLRRFPRQAGQRQAKTNRRITGHKIQMTRAQHPEPALPFRPVLAVTTLERQYKTHRVSETSLEHPAQPVAIFRI